MPRIAERRSGRPGRGAAGGPGRGEAALTDLAMHERSEAPTADLAGGLSVRLPVRTTWVEPAAGGGSVFRFTIARSDSPPVPSGS